MTSTRTAVPSSKKSIWSDLPRRLATICIGFPLVWKMLSNSTSAFIFFGGAHALVTREYSMLVMGCNPSQHDPKLPSSTFQRYGFCCISLLLAQIPSDSLFSGLICCTAGLLNLFELQPKQRERSCCYRYWILGLLVITIPFRTWYQLSQDFASTISVLLVVWNCDTGALLFGRLASKVLEPQHRMTVPVWIQQASPAKSMEGFVGGIVGGTWTAISWIPFLTNPTRHWVGNTSPSFDQLWKPLSHRIFLGISLSLLAILGDLVESAIKRQSQSKDSGSVLPGHGGILDRFDSSLLAVLWYQFLIKEWILH